MQDSFINSYHDIIITEKEKNHKEEHYIWCKELKTENVWEKKIMGTRS